MRRLKRGIPMTDFDQNPESDQDDLELLEAFDEDPDNNDLRVALFDWDMLHPADMTDD